MTTVIPHPWVAYIYVIVIVKGENNKTLIHGYIVGWKNASLATKLPFPPIKIWISFWCNYDFVSSLKIQVSGLLPFKRIQRCHFYWLIWTTWNKKRHSDHSCFGGGACAGGTELIIWGLGSANWHTVCGHVLHEAWGLFLWKKTKNKCVAVTFPKST